MQARPMSSCGVCPSVCVSVTFVNSVKTNKYIINFFSLSGSHTILVFSAPNGIIIYRLDPAPPPKGALNAGGVGRNSDSEIYLPAVNAATGHVLSKRSPVDHGHRLASYDTSLVVSGGVGCGRRWRNVCNKKPLRYAKETEQRISMHAVINL